MTTPDILESLLRIMADLPKDPVAPENRRTTRLLVSGYVPRGTVYRLAKQPTFVGHSYPLIVINAEDAAYLRAEWAHLPFVPDVDQEIADCCEQVFADRAAEKAGKVPRNRIAGLVDLEGAS